MTRTLAREELEKRRKCETIAGVRALLLENLSPKATEILEAAGIVVENHGGAMDEDELIQALQGVQLLGIRSKTQLTERVIDACPDLFAVGAFSIGTNQIDLAAAARKGIAAACIGEVRQPGRGIRAYRHGTSVPWPEFAVDELTRLF